MKELRKAEFLRISYALRDLELLRQRIHKAERYHSVNEVNLALLEKATSYLEERKVKVEPMKI